MNPNTILSKQKQSRSNAVIDKFSFSNRRVDPYILQVLRRCETYTQLQITQ